MNSDSCYFIGTHKMRPDKEEYDNLTAFLTDEIARAGRRVAALKRTQERHPKWGYYDVYAGDFKMIDTLIEEWEAILWALQEDQKRLEGKFTAPRQMEMNFA